MAIPRHPVYVAGGSQTAVLSTEHTLADVTRGDHVIDLVVDTSNMAASDTTVLRVKHDVSGSYAEMETLTFNNVQTEPIKLTTTTTGDLLRFTLEQTAGTGRVYSWKVLRT